MNSFEWNKIIGAVLGTAIFIFVVRLVAEKVYEPTCMAWWTACAPRIRASAIRPP
jgi:hypothetical protein